MQLSCAFFSSLIRFGSEPLRDASFEKVREGGSERPEGANRANDADSARWARSSLAKGILNKVFGDNERPEGGSRRTTAQTLGSHESAWSSCLMAKKKQHFRRQRTARGCESTHDSAHQGSHESSRVVFQSFHVEVEWRWPPKELKMTNANLLCSPCCHDRHNQGDHDQCLCMQLWRVLSFRHSSEIGQNR